MTIEQRPRGGRPGLGITQSVVLGRRNANSILVAANVEGKKGSEKWQWLKTLQENLTYGSDDPDIPDVSDLDDSEREAIDAVMKSEGASTEGERLRAKLNEISDGFQAMKNLGTIGEDEEEGGDEEGEKKSPPDAERVEDLLREVRDIVGDRVDFANAFLAVGGLSVLLGAASERLLVPRPVRSTCLLVLNDLVKRNPPVQYTLLDHEGIRALAAMYFAEFPAASQSLDSVDETDGLVRARVVSTMSAAVCGHGAAERMFCSSPLARKVIESGIGMHQADETLPAPPTSLRKRCIAFLQDLLVTGRSDILRLEYFKPCLEYVAETLLSEETEPNWGIRKCALQIFSSVLKQEEGAEVVLEMKETIASAGEKRLAQIGALDKKTMEQQEKEETGAESYLWGQINAKLV